VPRGAAFALSGLLFAVGLALSGMTQPAKVASFLDVAGRWDPSLALVMCGALLVYFAADRVARGLRRPWAAPAFAPRGPETIDGRLLGGAALFGVGWGLSGFCPGPALVSVGAATRSALWFLPAMAAGLALARLVAPRSTGCDAN
jgi:uncharacterized membrane protein YedE/YeeE